MYKAMLKHNKQDRIFMCCTCILDFVVAVFYIVLIWQENYFSAYETFFLIYFSFFCGSKFVIHALLISSTILKKFDFLRMYLLIIFIAVEISIIIVNCFYYGSGVGNFLADGYILFVFDFIMIAIFIHRYSFLKEIKKHLNEPAKQISESNEEITENIEETP